MHFLSLNLILYILMTLYLFLIFNMISRLHGFNHHVIYHYYKTILFRHLNLIGLFKIDEKLNFVVMIISPKNSLIFLKICLLFLKKIIDFFKLVNFFIDFVKSAQLFANFSKIDPIVLRFSKPSPISFKVNL